MAVVVRGVIYIERDKLQLSVETRADVLVFQYPPDKVLDLEVLDADAFTEALSTFLKQNNVIVNNVICIVSNAIIFERDFKNGEEAKIQEFLDNVPYDSITTKRLPIADGVKVLAANATFYSELSDALSKNNITSEFSIPESILGGPIGTFTASTARLVLTQSETLAKNKFFIDAPTDIFIPKTEEKKEEKKKNASLLYLIPVFGILLLVLVFMIVQPMLFKNNVKADAVPTVMPLPKSQKLTLSSTPAISPSITVTTPPSASPSAEVKKSVSVQILFDQSQTTNAEALKGLLATIGVTNVENQSSSVNAPKPLIIFSQTVDPVVQQQVLEQVKKIAPDVTVQISAPSQVDIAITLGKSS
jgi:hypothetical protein